VSTTILSIALACFACATKQGATAAFPAAQESVMERELENRRLEALHEQAEQRQGEEVALAKTHEEEEVAWQRADAPGCESPTITDACLGLSRFVELHPTSPNAEQARRILEASEPRISLLRDEAAWRTAYPRLCVPRSVEGGCSGVADYLALFPNGVHVKEARRLYRQYLTASEKSDKARRAREVRLWLEAQESSPR
jgi:hypothetical protein